MCLVSNSAYTQVCLEGVCDDPEAAECGNYTPILDSSSRDIIKGLILWEGYEAINDSILGEYSDMPTTALTHCCMLLRCTKL